MKRALILVLALGLFVGVLGGAALADEHPPGPPPEHGHILVLGLELDANDDIVGYHKCVDLANGRALRLQAHHSSVHTGRAGEALWSAGHGVAPTAPLWPDVRNCADFDALFGGG